MSTIATGATGQSIQVGFYDDAGLPLLGKVAADFPPLYYQKAGANAPVLITLSDLALITTAWASGGIKEIDGGDYRLDLPDAACSTDTRLKIIGSASNKRVICSPIDVKGDAYARLGAPAGASVSADVAAVQADTDNLQTRLPATLTGAGLMQVDVISIEGSDPTNQVRDAVLTDATRFPGASVTELRLARLDENVSAAKTLTAGERTTLVAAVWAAGSRTLSSFGTLVTDIWAAVVDSPGVTTLLARLTSLRAAALDLLDAAVSTRAPASTALSSAVWTTARAAKLDYLDVAISSRAAAGVTVVVSAVTPTGNAIGPLYLGSDYYHAEGRAITLSSAGWPDLPPGTTVALRCAAWGSIAGTVVSATGTKSVRFEVPRALLTRAGAFDFDVWAVVAPTSHEMSLTKGVATIRTSP